MRIHIFFVFLILSINYLFAEDIKITTSVSKDTFFIADKISLKYHIDKNNDLDVVVPQMPTFLGTCEVVKTSYDSLSSSFFLDLISFETGEIIILPITFVFEDPKSNKIFTRTSETIAVQVKEIELKNNPTLKEIQNNFLEEKQLNMRFIIIVVAILCLAFLAIYKFYIKRKKNNEKNI